MLKKFLYNFMRPRHFWRDVTFGELAEIYTSMGLRSFGFGIIGIFVPIYLYKQSVDLQSIFYFYFIFFCFRIPLSLVDGKIVGRIGPKHGIAMSTLLFIVFLSALLSYQEIGWPLWFLALLFTAANGLFFTSYHTDFSKIKDTKHSGKELGWLYMFERFGSAIGPLAGGIIATVFSPELTIVAAITVLVMSLVPLFLTNEPVKTHQTITYKNFPWRKHIWDFISLAAFHIENVASSVMWPLFIAIVIFTEGTYASLGVISAVAMLISLFGARIIGKYIDEKSGIKMLNYGVFANVLLHCLRPFALTPISAVSVSVANEPVTLSYRMPLMKGYYDAADSEKGYRIAYLVLTEITSAIAKALFYLVLLVASGYFEPIDVLQWSFIPVAIIGIAISMQRFPALVQQKK